MPQKITISYDTFQEAMCECVRIGYMKAVRAYEPTSDWIKETEVKQWLQSLGADPKLFCELVGHGDITRRRIGKSRNSAWLYRKSDIVEKVAGAKIYEAIINN